MTQDDLENTTITLRDVQAVLLSMFSAESILIGHSLESDLFALKVHPNTRAARLFVKKNHNLDSNNHVISFLNNNDSPVY